MTNNIYREPRQRFLFTSHLFYAEYKMPPRNSNTLSILRIVYICMKCPISYTSDYKLSFAQITIASFEKPELNDVISKSYAPLDVVKKYSKLIVHCMETQTG